MTTSNEPQGDYGYDLCHEEMRATRVPPPDAAQQAVRDPLLERRTGQRGIVVSGDYSYDEAHGF